MLRSKLTQQVVRRLYPYYGKEEAGSVASLLLEDLLGVPLPPSWALVHLRPAQQSKLHRAIKALQASEPIQYFLGYAYFLGRKFVVNQRVLIPRRETECLVDSVVREQAGRTKLRLLDVGTGTGCVAISLAHGLHEPLVHAFDSEVSALAVARRNARQHRVQVHFFCQNITCSIAKEGRLCNGYDIMVSNPPYVCPHEKKYLCRRVVLHEPHVALFTPSNDPLFFYRHMVRIAKTSLKAGGKLYVETHEDHASAVASLFEAANMTSLDIHKDFAGKDRIVTAIKAY